MSLFSLDATVSPLELKLNQSAFEKFYTDAQEKQSGNNSLGNAFSSAFDQNIRSFAKTLSQPVLFTLYGYPSLTIAQTV